MHAERLQKAALASRQDPMVFLAEEDVFGTVSSDPRFREAFATALRTLREKGTAATLQLYLDNGLGHPA